MPSASTTRRQFLNIAAATRAASVLACDNRNEAAHSVITHAIASMRCMIDSVRLCRGDHSRARYDGLGQFYASNRQADETGDESATTSITHIDAPVWSAAVRYQTSDPLQQAQERCW